MAITDIQISEELETNAPSIKYRGNEGPKSPQEMQQKAEYDMQEYIIEFENVFPEMKELRGTEEYMDMLEDYFRGLASKQNKSVMMAGSLGDEKDDISKEIFGKPVKDLNPDQLQELMEELERLRNKFSGGQPLPQDPTKPVNPFAPKPTGPVLPDRQMAAYGGIMSLDGRKQYGIGS